ncbi:MBL fold metallo-hydrolase [Arthrobacter sp. GMC3]|uniref:MBL fold metallo-hydrolase n=1 Tax=Arthrobacter sp. GMC3 TaxID=2058894 RepID=UPI000CE409DD|nr:MBL fold metallo-hydrolase [Arthrobacter sp. GMC3]
MSAWREVAEGVFQRRYDPLDISISLIRGTAGVTIVDTRSSPAEAQEILAHVAADFDLPIVAVINSHAHYDHTFGNQVFAGQTGVPIYGHHLVATHFQQFESPRLKRQQQDPAREPDRDWATVVLTPPTVPVTHRTRISPAGRDIDLIPLPPGHTDTDLAVFVPDQRVWILGDIVEESGPPMFGSGCFPFGWPDVLEELLTEIEPRDCIIPGHGSVINRDFVIAQLADLRATAAMIRDGWSRGLSIEQAVAAVSDDYPWPPQVLESALRRGYSQLSSG